jgi:DNA invertase Pin-like site-specific DNA recombinase
MGGIVSGRMTDAERTELAIHVIDQYLAGSSARKVAVATGRSLGTVRRILRENDVPMRQRGRTRESTSKEAGDG